MTYDKLYDDVCVCVTLLVRQTTGGTLLAPLQKVCHWQSHHYLELPLRLENRTLKLSFFWICSFNVSISGASIVIVGVSIDD